MSRQARSASAAGRGFVDARSAGTRRLRLERLEQRRLLTATHEVDWSSYVGGDSSEDSWKVATDSHDNVFVLGTTRSSDWISGGWDTSYAGNSDAYVLKISSAGEVLWGTYIGGNSIETARGLAVDADGNVYATGATGSSGWVSGGWDTEYDAGGDAYVVKLSNDGAHLWSSFLGGSRQENGDGVATDAAGNVYVTGLTYTDGWISGGWDTSFGGARDAFVVKLDGEGQFVWSSYLGGAYSEDGVGIAVDPSGDVLVTGSTQSAGWVSGGWDTSYAATPPQGPVVVRTSDGFVAKLSSAGAHLWSSYVGDQGDDSGWDVAADSSGNVFVSGGASSANWTSGGWDTSLGGDSDAFVLKLSSGGNHLWSTYLGGSDSEYGRSLAVAPNGHVVATGGTRSTGWVSGGWNTDLGGNTDAFVVELDNDGTHLWSSHVGGDAYDEGDGVAVDSAGNILVSGATTSAGWIAGGWDTTFSGSTDAFVARITEAKSADFNHDGMVNGHDFLAWQRGFGVAAATSDDGDADHDGAVDGNDLGVWQAQFGQQTPLLNQVGLSTTAVANQTAVPESSPPADELALVGRLVDAAFGLMGFDQVEADDADESILDAALEDADELRMAEAPVSLRHWAAVANSVALDMDEAQAGETRLPGELLGRIDGGVAGDLASNLGASNLGRQID